MLAKNLSEKKETTLNVNGRHITFIEFESADEGDFIKICTYEHAIGVDAEYTWFQNKYKNAELIKQEFTRIKLNDKIIKCDILTIKDENGKLRQLFFDISQMTEDLSNKSSGKVNKNLWDNKAKMIYNKLLNELDFKIFNNDEESLYKKVNDNISIGFDISYYFGFVVDENDDPFEIRKERYKCLQILKKYFSSKFLGKEAITDKIIGGYIRIDEINDIEIVFENYKKLEEEYKKMEHKG